MVTASEHEVNGKQSQSSTADATGTGRTGTPEPLSWQEQQDLKQCRQHAAQEETSAQTFAELAQRTADPSVKSYHEEEAAKHRAQAAKWRKRLAELVAQTTPTTPAETWTLDRVVEHVQAALPHHQADPWGAVPPIGRNRVDELTLLVDTLTWGPLASQKWFGQAHDTFIDEHSSKNFEGQPLLTPEQKAREEDLQALRAWGRRCLPSWP
jgi:hypothetical protein